MSIDDSVQGFELFDPYVIDFLNWANHHNSNNRKHRFIR